MVGLQIKICCIADQSEFEQVLSAGGDAIGLVGPMPSGPGTINLTQAKLIASHQNSTLSRFLLSSSCDVDELVGQIDKTGVDTLQIVNHIDPAIHDALATKLPDIRRVQVIHIEDETALSHIPAYSNRVHAFLLDSGRPGAKIAELGGTGRTHDWSISTKFVQTSPIPVFLAGGLNPDNIAEAVRQVRPFGIDVCSGVRTNGQLDPEKLKLFISIARSVDRTET